MRIHKQRRATSRTKFMHALFLSEEVALDMILATVEHDVCTLGIDVEITVLAADGAVATRDLLRF